MGAAIPFSVREVSNGTECEEKDLTAREIVVEVRLICELLSMTGIFRSWTLGWAKLGQQLLCREHIKAGKSACLQSASNLHFLLL